MRPPPRLPEAPLGRQTAWNAGFFLRAFLLLAGVCVRTGWGRGQGRFVQRAPFCPRVLESGFADGADARRRGSL